MAPSLPDELVLTRRGPVAVLTIDRPAKRNALHAPMWAGLGAIPELLAAEPPRALVITGSGGHFDGHFALGREENRVAFGPLH